MHHVVVWIGNLDEMRLDRRQLEDWLTPDERATVGRLRGALLAHRAAASRVSLRHILASQLGTRARDIELANGTHGKPELAGRLARLLHFNVSHSGPALAIATCPTSPVGIDIEHVDLSRDLPATVLAPGELAQLGAMNAARRCAAFHRAWVRKEAILKAAGLGLSGAPEIVEVPLAPSRSCRPASLPPGLGCAAGWTLLDLDLGLEIAAAIAVPDILAEIHGIYQISLLSMRDKINRVAKTSPAIGNDSGRNDIDRNSLCQSSSHLHISVLMR
ncbi:MAG: 4'-phosphopantetheinyl transferase superfamily protein [Hyphomicrobiaceae bacterium]|nr:4'-phosphopantetheinyl transferase superfamily protein [Hyphomicrobiaceae bacterium]